MKLFFSLCSGVMILLGCISTNNNNKPVRKYSTCIINHETFNDSLQYKIIETKCPNKWRRTLFVYINNIVSDSAIIQHIPLKTLHIEGYHKVEKTTYERTNHQTFIIDKITEHHNDFVLTSTDTLNNKIIVDSAGSIIQLNANYSLPI